MLNDELLDAKVESQNYQKQLKETDNILYALRLGIKQIYDKLEESRLGDHGVTESNMMNYLGIIEQRTIELLKMYQSCANKGNFDPFEENKVRPKTQKDVVKMKVDSTEPDDTTPDANPLTAHEFIEKAQKMLKDDQK